jgi:hypothetical protein
VFFVLPWLVPPASLGSSTEDTPPTVATDEQPPAGTTARPPIRIPRPVREPAPVVRRPRTILDEMFAPKRG